MALIHFRNNENIEGRKFYEKALESARVFEDELFLCLLDVLEALFIKSANKPFLFYLKLSSTFFLLLYMP